MAKQPLQPLPFDYEGETDLLSGQDDLLKQQLAQALALRSNFAEGHTSPFGALLGGVGDIVNASKSKQQAALLRGQQQDVLGQRRALLTKKEQLDADRLAKKEAQRADFSKADAADMALLDGASPEEQQKVLAQVLRHQQQRGLQATLSGDADFAKYGEALGKGAHQTQQDAFESQRLGETSRHDRAMEGQGKYTVTQGQDGIIRAVNTRNPRDVVELGKFDPTKSKSHGGGGAGELKESDWKAFFSQLNSNTSRSGELGKNQQRINTALRALQLVDDGKGGIRDLDKREIPELAMTLQNLLSPGGHSSTEVEHLIPTTFQGNVQGFLENLTNEPQGLGMKAFVEKMKHTVERERDASMTALQKAQYGIVPQGKRFYEADKDRFLNSLRGLGLDPESLDEATLLPKQMQPTAAGGSGPATSGGLTPEQQKRLAELRAKREAGALK